MKLSKYEKETIINFNEEEENATVYSCSKRVWSKCEKAAYKLIDTNLDSDGNVISKTYETRKKNISFRKQRTLSVEYRTLLKERAGKMREELAVSII